MIIPYKAPLNAKIAIIAPASAPSAMDLKAGAVRLGRLGYRAVDYTGAMRKKGNDTNRLASLNKGLKDEAVAILIAARGGYGCLRILDKLDYGMIKKSRKIIMGFSDITALSLAIFKKTGMVTFSGPMIRTHFADKIPLLTKISFQNMVHGNLIKGSGYDLLELGGINLRSGSSSGILLGGNLSVLCRMIGSKFLPNLNGAILFLEDIDEHPGKLDNMFSQLRLSGILDNAAGIMLGYFSDCFKGSRIKQKKLIYEFLSDHLGRLKIPIMYNLPFGHEDKIITLPIGLPVRLECRKGTLTFRENPVQ